MAQANHALLKRLSEPPQLQRTCGLQVTQALRLKCMFIVNRQRFYIPFTTKDSQCSARLMELHIFPKMDDKRTAWLFQIELCLQLTSLTSPDWNRWTYVAATAVSLRNQSVLGGSEIHHGGYTSQGPYILAGHRHPLPS